MRVCAARLGAPCADPVQWSRPLPLHITQQVHEQTIIIKGTPKIKGVNNIQLTCKLLSTI